MYTLFTRYLVHLDKTDAKLVSNIWLSTERVISKENTPIMILSH
jgi:hypothetical protein